MVSAIELDDPVAAGKRPGEPKRAHSGLGAGGNETQPLDRRHGFDNQLPESDLVLGRRAERHSVLRGVGHRLDDGRLGMAQDEWPPGAEEVDVIVTVGIVDVGSFSVGHERWGPTHGTERANWAVYAAREKLLGPLEELRRSIDGAQPHAS